MSRAILLKQLSICLLLLGCISCNAQEKVIAITPTSATSLETPEPTPSICSPVPADAKIGNIEGIYAAGGTQTNLETQEKYDFYYLLRFYSDSQVFYAWTAGMPVKPTLSEHWDEINKWFYRNENDVIEWGPFTSLGSAYYVKNEQIWFTITIAEESDIHQGNIVATFCGSLSDDSMTLNSFNNVNDRKIIGTIYHKMVTPNK